MYFTELQKKTETNLYFLLHTECINSFCLLL